MPLPPQRLALTIALLISATSTQAKNVNIDTATTTAQTLGGSDTLTISAPGSITNAGKTVSLKDSTSGAGVIIDNAGQIISTGGRAIDSSGDLTQARNYSIYNRAGGQILGFNDALRIDSNFVSGSLLIDNSGIIRSTTGQGLDLDALRSNGVTTTIINRAGALIRGDASDGMKTGANATITNYGEISTGDSHNADEKFDGIDIDSATGVTVTNYGTISGGRHGITTDLGATLVNYGQITGRNGSGFGSDGDGTVINHGTITGAYSGLQANGDGDGVDIDKIAHIENYGTIQGVGAGGVDKGGFANGSEGIALGGGYILNAKGALISGADSAILVDDGSGGSGVAATTLENYGTIQGLNGFGVKLVGEFADTVINGGTISGSNGLALDLGGGNDNLTLRSGSRFIGLVDGGSGYDRIVMDDAAGGSFGDSRNFEFLEVRQGAWTLTGNGDFSDGGAVRNGARLINQGGIAGSMTVDAGGVYAGGGSVGNLQVDGTLQTNTQLGTAKISHDLTFGSGGTLAYGVNADGSSAPVIVGGTANLNGATLAVNPGSGTYPWQSRYTVLQAASINGTFGNVTSDYAFLTPTLAYTPTAVDLTYTRNDVAFNEMALTGNGGNAANSLASLGKNNVLYNALLNTSTTSAGAAIEQLAGASNANLTSATLGASSQVGSSMLSTMRQMGGSSGLMVGLEQKDTPVLAANGVPTEARNLNDPNAQGRLWLQAIGGYGKLDGEHGNSSLEQRTKGSVIGADWALNPQWRLGVLGGYSKTDLDATGSDGNVESWHAGVYAVHQNGPMALRLGAAYSGHQGDSKRTVAFDGFNDRLKGDYDADSQQAFAELGYALGNGRLSTEPFASLGYQRYHRDSYQEKGGPAALQVDAQTQDNFNSTLGVRLAYLGTLDNGMSLTPRVTTGWKHTYGDVSNSTRQAFVVGGTAFSVDGSSLDRDSLVLEAGVDLGISARHTIGVGYSGEIGNNSRNHGLIGQWQMAF
ncbi:autotransporter outer membrane beta-barrel domain-containing protein [Pseudomonas vancouverensis]|uniref:Autotransporter domain-containing protein n=1 Tax=Pseudomonas vancouverensis TaxID=95300 RepID=A0A1H2PE08_PSEVA|nr:autotransporter domain-containing protein [Pseudomonas vancouverensis]KAB0497837.1 autotransporter domain-containing protein [Pseudomonas vancouverensis]TDB66564.1 autotransporter domain-containing protein [Pseudomonas vancouverensis]SDV15892.1 outer membrane autotransporter barrel domain-containing protein [Pseudomonas vancouverensis]